jgi:hypothetical protein
MTWKWVDLCFICIKNNLTTYRLHHSISFLGYDAISNISKLKVHDDHELSSSPTSTAIYLIQKPSPPLSSLSPARDDEGYSGSSDVSDNHYPFESAIISANGLFEQYHMNDFHRRQSSLYDIPRRYIDRMNVSHISPDISLV